MDWSMRLANPKMRFLGEKREVTRRILDQEDHTRTHNGNPLPNKNCRCFFSTVRSCFQIMKRLSDNLCRSMMRISVLLIFLILGSSGCASPTTLSPSRRLKKDNAPVVLVRSTLFRETRGVGVIIHSSREHGTYVLTAGHVVDPIGWKSILVPKEFHTQSKKEDLALDFDIVYSELQANIGAGDVADEADNGRLRDFAILRLESSEIFRACPIKSIKEGEKTHVETFSVFSSKARLQRVHCEMLNTGSSLVHGVLPLNRDLVEGMSGSPVIQGDGVGAVLIALSSKRAGEEKRLIGVALDLKTMNELILKSDLGFLLKDRE